jgi:hypothetical protein
MSFPSEFETGSEMLKLGGDGELVNTAECLSLENTYKKKKCWDVGSRRNKAETDIRKRQRVWSGRHSSLHQAGISFCLLASRYQQCHGVTDNRTVPCHEA